MLQVGYFNSHNGEENPPCPAAMPPMSLKSFFDQFLNARYNLWIFRQQQLTHRPEDRHQFSGWNSI
jgi:hypothetical protein